MKKAPLSGRFPPVFFLCATAVWLVVAVSGIPGCGKKAPPLPPHSDPMPPVTDLSCDLQGSRVVLTWTLPDEVKQGAFGEGEMLVSRAQTSLTDELCPECPLAFQRIAALPIGSKPTWEEDVPQGFRFTYRVVLHMDSGRSSEPSNLATFDYQGPGK